MCLHFTTANTPGTHDPGFGGVFFSGIAGAAYAQVDLLSSVANLFSILQELFFEYYKYFTNSFMGFPGNTVHETSKESTM